MTFLEYLFTCHKELICAVSMRSLCWELAFVAGDRKFLWRRYENKDMEGC